MFSSLIVSLNSQISSTPNCCNHIHSQTHLLLLPFHPYTSSLRVILPYLLNGVPCIHVIHGRWEIFVVLLSRPTKQAIAELFIGTIKVGLEFFDQLESSSIWNYHGSSFQERHCGQTACRTAESALRVLWNGYRIGECLECWLSTLNSYVHSRIRLFHE